jgi:hypothetical protein
VPPREVAGRRLPDVEFGSLPDDPRPGDYWRYLKDGEPMTLADGGRWSTNLTHGVWGFYSPDGNGMGTLMSHTVREHEDGTISVRPGDGSSNSILHRGGAQGKVWHGYVERGVWRET